MIYKKIEINNRLLFISNNLIMTRNKKNQKLHSYQLNVHKTLIKPFVGKDKLLNIYNKWKKVNIKIVPPMPIESGKEATDEDESFKIIIEGKHKGSVRECSRELVTRYQKMCIVIQNIMKTNMETHVHDENCNHVHDDEESIEDEPGNLILDIKDE